MLLGQKPRILTTNGGLWASLEPMMQQEHLEQGWDAAQGDTAWSGGLSVLFPALFPEYGSAEPHLSWLSTVSVKQQHWPSLKYKAEEEHGCHQNNHQDKKKISKRIQEQTVINWQQITVI